MGNVCVALDGVNFCAALPSSCGSYHSWWPFGLLSILLGDEHVSDALEPGCARRCLQNEAVGADETGQHERVFSLLPFSFVRGNMHFFLSGWEMHTCDSVCPLVLFFSSQDG